MAKVKMRVVRAHMSDYGMARRGQTIEVDPGRALELEANGLAVPEVGSKMATPAPFNKAVQAAPGNKQLKVGAEGDALAATPTREPPAGGQAGEEEPQSLLPAGRRRAKRRSKK